MHGRRGWEAEQVLSPCYATRAAPVIRPRNREGAPFTRLHHPSPRVAAGEPEPREGQGVAPGGVYTDVEEGFVGGEILGRIGDTRWFYNPNVEVVFVDPGDLVTANADFHYDLAIAEPVDVWVGGGPALLLRDRGDGPRLRDRDEDETDLGLNALAGVGFNRGGASRSYIQGKVLFSDETEAALAFGLRFF